MNFCVFHSTYLYKNNQKGVRQKAIRSEALGRKSE